MIFSSLVTKKDYMYPAKGCEKMKVMKVHFHVSTKYHIRIIKGKWLCSVIWANNFMTQQRFLLPFGLFSGQLLQNHYRTKKFDKAWKLTWMLN